MGRDEVFKAKAQLGRGSKKNWCKPGILSPKKGVQRNPKGHNSHSAVSQPLKRKISFTSPSSSAKTVVHTKTYRKRKLRKWRKCKGVWDRAAFEKDREKREQLKLQVKQSKISEYKDDMDEIEAVRKRRRSAVVDHFCIFDCH